MSEGNRSAVDIDLLWICSQLSDTRERLCREGFIEFHQIDLIDRQAGARERFAHRWNRADSHD